MDIKTSIALSNEMKHPNRDMVPKLLVQAMFMLVLATLARVSYATLTNRPVGSVVAHSDIAREITVTLDGSRSDGVAVLDQDGTQIAHSTENKAGFIDVIWISIKRERIVQKIQLNEPIRVVRRENGHVAVIDDSTGWKIELIGYGQDNVAAFAKLVD